MDMNTEIMVFAGFGIGLFIVFFFGKLLLAPAKLILRLCINSLLGAGFIAFVNIALGHFGITISLNLVTAMIVGLLGIPGAILLLFI